MGFFEDVTTKAKEIFEETERVTTDVISIQKQKLDLASLKNKIRKKYELLGELTYVSAVEGKETAQESEKVIEEIKALKEEAEELSAKIAIQKGEKSCSCGASNTKDAKFCKDCGKEFQDE